MENNTDTINIFAISTQLAKAIMELGDSKRVYNQHLAPHTNEHTNTIFNQEITNLISRISELRNQIQQLETITNINKTTNNN